MRIAGSKVLAHLTAEERKLALRATGPSLKALAEKDAAALSARARRAAKKHRDRVRDDVRAAQRRKGARGAVVADPMAAKKVELFEEVARRLDERRDAASLAPARREARRANPKRKRGSAKEAGATQSAKRRGRAASRALERAASEAVVDLMARDLLDLVSRGDLDALRALFGTVPTLPPPPVTDHDEDRLQTAVRRRTGRGGKGAKGTLTPLSRDVKLDRRRLYGDSNLKRRHAHVSARGRRQQARRDARR